MQAEQAQFQQEKNLLVFRLREEEGDNNRGEEENRWK
jgi:hypothetical protein